MMKWRFKADTVIFVCQCFTQRSFVSVYISLMYILYLWLNQHHQCCINDTKRNVDVFQLLCECFVLLTCRAVSHHLWSLCLSAIASCWSHFWMFTTTDGGNLYLFECFLLSIFQNSFQKLLSWSCCDNVLNMTYFTTLNVHFWADVTGKACPACGRCCWLKFKNVKNVYLLKKPAWFCTIKHTTSL